MKLLLAEDEQIFSDTLVTFLRKNQYEVDAVYDGRAALACMETTYYDAAILDVMMPRMDGFTVTKMARDKGITLPILLLTARSEIEDRVSGLDSGANDYLPKPFDTRELLARIRALLRIEELSGTGHLQAGCLKLDIASLELSSGTGSFRLSGKEMNMMKALMRAPGEYIPVLQFTEKGTGKGNIEKEMSVKAYMMFLNRKLDALRSGMHICLQEGNIMLTGGDK